jgi:hypothetical protein
VGAIGTIHRLLYELIVFFNRIFGSLLFSHQLYNARFARIDELTSLSSPLKDRETRGAFPFSRLKGIQML